MALPKNCFSLCILLSVTSVSHAGNGKLLGTTGVTQIEGSSGGGLVPWATLAGYDTREEWSSTVFFTRVSLNNYRLQAYGINTGFKDRVELSLARQTFELRDLPFGEREINQQILGLKIKLVGDMVYQDLPLLSLGLQRKTVENATIAAAAGAKDPDQGTDLYLAASRAHLGAVFGYNIAWSFTLRATKANQFGLLGFGGDQNNRYEIMPEGSLAVFLNRHTAAGIEYRQKPDNLSFAKEEQAYDIFLAYVPNKHFNLTLAWVNLGSIAGLDDQTGAYVSLTGYLW